MAKFPFTITESNITVLINGAMERVPQTHMGFAALAEHLKGDMHDAEFIATLLDKRAAVARLTAGKVKVVGTTVYYNGVPVRSTLASKLVYMLDEGFNAEPWAKFMDRIAQNPSDNSREMLFDFIERWESPLDDEGRFIAFKGVREDYTDVRTGTFDNSPGKIVEMNRDDVEDDPNKTCSAGLHVCASHYLDSFWTGYKILAVAVAPEDVVSIPVDYKYSKMRVCKYEVLGDVEDDRHRDRIETSRVVGTSEGGTVGEVKTAPVFPVASDAAEEEPLFREMSETYYELDEDLSIDYNDVVYDTKTQVFGVVKNVFELDYTDDDHPQNKEWRDGEIAGWDVPVMYVYEIELDSGETCEELLHEEEGSERFVYATEVEDYESDYADCFECGAPVDFEGELCDTCEYDEEMRLSEEAEDGFEDEDEALTFYHEATGQTFTATRVLAIVDDIGQRGFDRVHGVPRTTVQEWLKAIKA